MLFYLLLLPVLLAPAVWVYLGRYAGSNDHAELLIHPPTRPPQPSGLRPATKRKHAVRGLSFMASDRPMVNPFVNATPNLTPYERAKLSVLSVTLLPVRMVLAVLVLTVAVLWLSVCTLGVSPKALRTRPLPGWRRAMRFPTKVFTRLYVRVARGAWACSEQDLSAERLHCWQVLDVFRVLLHQRNRKAVQSRRSSGDCSEPRILHRASVLGGLSHAVGCVARSQCSCAHHRAGYSRPAVHPRRCVTCLMWKAQATVVPTPHVSS